MKYSVIITTSGTGSRLGEITKKTNKALIPINNRPTIEYILDRYDDNIPLVVTVGYLAEQVREYLSKNHPNRDITFVNINPFEGPGSSLGYSLLQTEKFVQCPFIFHACDTIVTEDIPAPDHNWAAGFHLPNNANTSAYRTQTINHGQIVKVNEKGVQDFDLIHIGLSGIYDYNFFWEILNKLHSERPPEDTSLSDVHVIEKMIDSGQIFRSVELTKWFDTGNLKSLELTEQALQNEATN